MPQNVIRRLIHFFHNTRKCIFYRLPSTRPIPRQNLQSCHNYSFEKVKGNRECCAQYLPSNFKSSNNQIPSNFETCGNAFKPYSKVKFYSISMDFPKFHECSPNLLHPLDKSLCFFFYPVPHLSSLVTYSQKVCSPCGS